MEPLAPPPGTFGRIRQPGPPAEGRPGTGLRRGRRGLIAARRRGSRRSPDAAAQQHGPAWPAQSRPGVTRQAAPQARQVTGRGRRRRPKRSSATVRAAPTSALSAGEVGQRSAPANFQPTSVTFIGTAVGAVIGQAGSPGHCASIYCTSLAGTSDYGTQLVRGQRPGHAGAPSGAPGVSQLRFLNLRDGWAFGPRAVCDQRRRPALDGGADLGLRVTDLETAGATRSRSSPAARGPAPAYAAQLHQLLAVHLGRPAAASGTPCPGRPAISPAGLAGPRRPRAWSHGARRRTGYVLAPDRRALQRPGDRRGLAPRRQAPCAPGAPGPGGQPTGGQLAPARASSAELLTTGTTGAGGSQAKALRPPVTASAGCVGTPRRRRDGRSLACGQELRGGPRHHRGIDCLGRRRD